MTGTHALVQTSTGGSPAVVTLTLLALLVTAVLALAVAYVIGRGYRRNRDHARLYLAVGLVLLATVPIGLQFVLTNVGGVSPGLRSVAVYTSKLAGLGAMLYAIYGAARRREAHGPAAGRDPTGNTNTNTSGPDDPNDPNDPNDSNDSNDPKGDEEAAGNGDEDDEVEP